MTETFTVSTIKEKISDCFTFLKENEEKFRIFTPFFFNDGDGLFIVLKKQNEEWILSDEGSTFMKLSFYTDNIDYSSFEQLHKRFNTKDISGEIVLKVNQNNIGKQIFNFIQVILHISS